MRQPKSTLLPGQVFGRLTLLSEAPRRRNGTHIYWLCSCSCGSPPREVYQSNLVHVPRITSSCGCLNKEKMREIGKANITHGLSKTAEYSIWVGMWVRCTSPNDMHYEAYKDRTPSEAWKSFETFYADMGPRPSKQHSLERVKNDLPYSKENCVWATAKEQSLNRKSTHWLTFQGRTQCLQDWSKELLLSKKTISGRLALGWPIEKVLSTERFRGLYARK